MPVICRYFSRKRAVNCRFQDEHLPGPRQECTARGALEQLHIQVVLTIQWSRIQVPAGPPDKKTNPSSGWSSFVYCRVLARVRGGSCGLRRFARAPGFGRFHSLQAILLSCLAHLGGRKSTSVSKSPVTNQQLIRGLFKRLIRSIGRRWKQRCQTSGQEILERLLKSGPLPTMTGHCSSISEAGGGAVYGYAFELCFHVATRDDCGVCREQTEQAP